MWDINDNLATMQTSFHYCYKYVRIVELARISTINNV